MGVGPDLSGLRIDRICHGQVVSDVVVNVCSRGTDGGEKPKNEDKRN
jgi:hypothetical protein